MAIKSNFCEKRIESSNEFLSNLVKLLDQFPNANSDNSGVDVLVETYGSVERVTNFHYEKVNIYSKL